MKLEGRTVNFLGDSITEGSGVSNIAENRYDNRLKKMYNLKATNNYGKGRSFYITGLPYSAENAKLLYRAILWTAGKEDMDKKSYCTNLLTEAHFYGDRYAITNNTSVEQKTIFFDMNGNSQEIILKPYEIKWIMFN